MVLHPTLRSARLATSGSTGFSSHGNEELPAHDEVAASLTECACGWFKLLLRME